MASVRKAQVNYGNYWRSSEDVTVLLGCKWLYSTTFLGRGRRNFQP